MIEHRTWYVVPLDEGWLVKERTAAQGEICDSKAAAMARAEELCLGSAPARYLVRRSDGTIETEVRPVDHPRIEPLREIDLSHG